MARGTARLVKKQRNLRESERKSCPIRKGFANARQGRRRAKKARRWRPFAPITRRRQLESKRAASACPPAPPAPRPRAPLPRLRAQAGLALGRQSGPGTRAPKRGCRATCLATCENESTHKSTLRLIRFLKPTALLEVPRMQLVSSSSTSTIVAIAACNRRAV